MTIYWDIIETPLNEFAAWVDDKGRVVRLYLSPKGAAKIDPLAQRKPAALSDVRRQLGEYAKGKRQAFDLELAAQGPDFNRRVWTALQGIPFGTTTSYGALAKTIGHPGAARAVGAANGANPIALIVPCHRVIGANGSLTGYAGGLPLKRKLLQHEARVIGAPFDLFP